jgi:phosphoribosylaminoimidazole (AIR) synthetase
MVKQFGLVGWRWAALTSIRSSTAAPGAKAVVIGVKSSIHSNGLSLARKAFFADHRCAIDHKFDEPSVTLGEELLRPTNIYVREALT